jgi:hypothetical protein
MSEGIYNIIPKEERLKLKRFHKSDPYYFQVKEGIITPPVHDFEIVQNLKKGRDNQSVK